jgi:carboxypeptidase Taq
VGKHRRALASVLGAFLPRTEKDLPNAVGRRGLKAFYKAINKVEPSFIRVNADEATYNMHIMLRLEIEIGMVDGSHRRQRPARNLEHENAGLSRRHPAQRRKGVLQDIHWSYGSIGYFSTYALGNIISAQLWETVNKDIRDLEDQIRKGKFDELRNWLREKIHTTGTNMTRRTWCKR